jgi:hypothetical protein
MNMRLFSSSLAALLIAGGGSAALGQATAQRGPIPITGNVPPLCTAGTNTSGSGNFDLGVLTNVGTGLLRPDLAAPPKVLTGAFCSARSNITVSATPLLSVNNVATPSGGFSRTVNFTATAAGWTTAPATFTTGAASNPAATQLRATPFSGDITVSINGFSTGGGNGLRLVADPAYLGSVTVTLAVAS